MCKPSVTTVMALLLFLACIDGRQYPISVGRQLRQDGAVITNVADKPDPVYTSGNTEVIKHQADTADVPSDSVGATAKDAKAIVDNNADSKKLQVDAPTQENVPDAGDKVKPTLIATQPESNKTLDAVTICFNACNSAQIQCNTQCDASGFSAGCYAACNQTQVECGTACLSGIEGMTHQDQQQQPDNVNVNQPVASTPSTTPKTESQDSGSVDTTTAKDKEQPATSDKPALQDTGNNMVSVTVNDNKQV